MHSSVYETGGERPLGSSDVLIAITTLVTEGRIQDKKNTLRGYAEGPHCHKSKSSTGHACESVDAPLCSRYDKIRSHVLALWQKSIPLCIEVLLTADCECGKTLASSLDISSSSKQSESPHSPDLTSPTVTSLSTTGTLLLEQWYLTVEHRRSKDATSFTTDQLLNAVRSQLHFSQLAAWFASNPDNNSALFPNIQNKNIIYRLTIPGETFKQSKFNMNHTEHNFPPADIGNKNYLKVTMHSLPRLEKMPVLLCSNCPSPEGASPTRDNQNGNCLDCDSVPPTQLFDDRMHFSCTQHGKHKCTYDEDDVDNESYNFRENDLKHKPKVRCLNSNMIEDSPTKSEAAANMPIFYNFEPLFSPEPDYLCRKDFENFIQNQPRTSTINFFTVPSTSKCVQNNFSNSIASNSGQKSAQTKINNNSINTCNHELSNLKTNQTSGFHENLSALSLNCSPVSSNTSVLSLNSSPNVLAELNNLSDPPRPNKVPIVHRLSPTSPIAIKSNTSVGSNILINDLNKTQSKSDILLNAIMRSSRKQDGGSVEGESALNGRQCCKCSMCSERLGSSKMQYGRVCDCCYCDCNNGSTPERFGNKLASDERLNAACDISDSKCDNMNEKMSDNINEIYSFTSNNTSNKEFLYIEENFCDSLGKSNCAINNSIEDSNNKSNIMERRSVGTKKRLEIDVSQKLNCQISPSTSKYKFENHGATPKQLNHEAKNRNQYRDYRTNGMSKILSENRKDLYRNGCLLETKRRIDFEENGSRPCLKKISDSDSMRKRLLLNANCSKNQESAVDLDRECELLLQSNPHDVTDIPTALDQKKFRKSLDNAASMVFHSRTGLPLTSSPAPIRKGTTCFDYDSNINSVSAIRSALFELPAGTVGDEDSGSDCSVVSPCSPDVNLNFPRISKSVFKRSYPQSRSGLLGNFEESVLNGRLEPVSTVAGFTAEIGASGLFCPRHKTFPVTVFFYALGDMDRMSVPYLGHINLGRKGYNVPKSGLVQITLFNPLGTVVKMFVISYDLSDMPPNSQTFIRQRTLYLPQDCPELHGPDAEYSHKWGQKYLRFLIHLRFMSSKSGRIYLHTDIRMIIFNKADMDTATGLLKDPGHEMRSFIHCPTNPKYSPRL